MIRDRIVVGLRDATLSEKLQMDPDLTLDKAVVAARQREAVKTQQAVVRGEHPSIDAIRAKVPIKGSHKVVEILADSLRHRVDVPHRVPR